MKHFTLLMAIICSAIFARAQQPALYECIYQYAVHGQDTSGEPFVDTYYTVLQIGNAQAKFQDYASFALDSLNSRGDATPELLDQYKRRERTSVNFFDQTVFQNFPAGKMTVWSVITPDYYTYEETGRPVRWSLSEDTDTLCGYPCRKATGSYGGRQWTAWYAPEIPAQFGPWKLTGLPGLILAATDSEGIHRFTAISFRPATAPISPLPQQSALSTTREKFIKAKNRFEKAPMQNLPVEAISVIKVEKMSEGAQDNSISINGVPLRLHTHPYIPLETE